jgi:integrase
MTELADEYLALRRGLGFDLVSHGFHVLSFARFLDGISHRGPITIDLALQWVRLSRSTHKITLARRLHAVRAFAKHRALFDEGTEIPPANLFGPYSIRPTPHIYTEKEVQDLVRDAHALWPQLPLLGTSIAALLGLLACTGMRVSEAVALTRQDVDLSAGVLLIAKTKFRKSRLVPLHPSAVTALRRYTERRNAQHPYTTCRAFFINQHGRALRKRRVDDGFHEIRHRLGFTGEHRRPRIHDLRHTFIVRRVLEWYRAGVNVDAKMAALATYVGHVTPHSTYWYLTAIPELMAITAQRFEAFAMGGQP